MSLSGTVVAALTCLETSVTVMRGDMMARMDRLQSRLASLDEHLTMGLGHSDQVVQSNRLLGERINSLTKLVRLLEGRIDQLEERGPPT